MKKDETIFAMIPARLGSHRLRMKNLSLLKGKPLIYYAIQAAKKAGIFNRIIVNSECALFRNIAERYGVRFYKRPDRLAASNAKSDPVVYDFLKHNPCDILVWVNPISPLQTAEEVRRVVDFFIRKRLDSLITVKDEPVHCIYKNKPINFRMDKVFARTQDLLPVQGFVYSVMMWRSNVFVKTFEKKGHALLCGKRGFYAVSKASSIIVKRKEDLMLAESLMNLSGRKRKYKIKYDKILNIS